MWEGWWLYSRLGNLFHGRRVWRYSFVGLPLLIAIFGLLSLFSLVDIKVSVAQGSVYYVTASGGGTACSQVNPCLLETAVTQSTDGDQIRVAGGTYLAVATNPVISLTKTITLTGGYNSSDWLEDPDPQLNRTILDGQTTNQVIRIEGVVSPTIEGFDIRNGSDTQGGGIYNQAGAPLIRNNRIYNNAATIGAGIDDNGSAQIESNAIFDNQAANEGGGIFVGGTGDATILFNEIYSNTAGSDGGGIFIANNAESLIEGNNIFQNQAANGGGFSTFGTSSTLMQNNIFYQNDASSLGGAVRAIGTMELWNNTIAGNTAATNGGGIIVEFGTIRISNTIVVSNTGGAGIRIDGGAVTGDFNNIFGNSSDATFTNTVSTDPLFINYDTFNLHLRSGSLNIDAADPATPASVNTDIDGQARPNGAGVDIGADEFYASIPAFSLTPSEINEFVDRGTTAVYTHTLENEGTVPDDYTFTCSNNRGWVVTCPNPVSNLGIGSAVDVQTSVTVSATEPGLAVGTTTITATSATSPTLFEKVLVHNTVNPMPGVTFTPNFSATLLPGEIITFTHLITNTGDSQDTFNITVDSDPGGWAEIVPSGPFSLPLAVGASASVRVRVTVPPAAAEGIGNTAVIKAASSFDPQVFDTVENLVTAKATVGTRYVSTAGRDADNNCTQSNDPCQTIERGVGQASFEDEVRVREGTYSENELFINDTIFVSGGWNNSFSAQSEPDTTTINPSGSNRLFNIAVGSLIQPTISNFTLEDGNGGLLAGAILVGQSSQPDLSSLILQRNLAGRGGGIYVDQYASVSLTNVQFYTNTATALEGGALYINGGAVEMQDNVLVNNDATLEGGAVYIGNGGQLVTTNALFYNNQAGDDGGAIYADAGILNDAFSTYVANSSGGDGGAVANNTAAVEINSSIIVSNTAVSNGAVYNNTGTAVIAYSDLWNNGVNPTNVVSLTNNISADPLFSDSAFHLSLGSPAIDNGDPNAVLDADFEGDFRPSDQGFDIGYDELPGCVAKRDSTIYGSIQAAIDKPDAVSDLILVSGTCRGVNTILVGGDTISQTVHITETVTIQGGWNSSFSSRDFSPTIIDPEGRGRGVYVTGGASVQPTMETITIVNGDATGLGGGPADEDAGGGLYNADATLELIGVGVMTNTAVLGGGLYNDSGTLSVTARFPSGNEEIKRGDLLGNVATTGGAIFINDGTFFLDSSILHRNTADDGAGLYLNGGTITATNAIFATNSATNRGGAVYNAANTAVSLQHNTVYSNAAGIDGGGVYSNIGDPIVRNNIFESNQATTGPAIAVNSGTPDVDFNYYYDQTNPVTGVPTGTSSIESAIPPGLVDPLNGDFHLADSGGAVDKGDPDSVVTQDFEEDPRPSNQSTDMGADEVAGCRVRLNDTIYGSIQAAMTDAVAGDVIDVSGICSGVHQYETGLGAGACRGDNGTIFTTVHIDEDVTLLGGWNENFTSRNSTTILDALNTGRVIYIAPGTSPTIDRFDIRQGSLSGTNANGAGICIDQATPTILNNQIYSNTATNGAAVYSFDSTPILDAGNRIHHNSATGNGGGLFVEASGAFTATIQNNFVYSNTAVNGGAFYNASGDHRLWHNTIVENSGTMGGAIYVAADSPDIRGNIIISNSATTAGGAFGAGGAAPLLAYNDFYAQQGGDIGGTIATTGTGSISVDPAFSNDTYNITIDSPVVDMGDPTLPITQDFEADIRPSHQGTDLGADEVGGCSAYIEGDPDTIYGSLQLAVDLAADGKTVYVNGTCYGVNDRQNSGAVQVTQNTFISKNLTIDGSWRSGSATLDALENGRVVYIDAGVAVTLTNIQLTGGDAAGAGIGNSGGGVYNTGTLIVDNVTVVENTAVSGGGIYNTAVITLENSTLDNNSATNGAGFYNDTSSGFAALIGQNRFENNVAAGGGGALYQNNGDLLLDGNELFDNTANEGGAVYLTGGSGDTVDVHNNFIVRNQATTGGGLYNNNTAADVLHNTFYANTAGSGSGGGLWSQNNSLTIRSNIVDFNTGTGINAPAGTDIDYNNVIANTLGGYGGGSSAGASDIMTTPMYISIGADNYHLFDDSPGVDEADPSSPLTADFDGDLRPTNNGPDIGADEINSCLVRVINPNDSSENLFGVLQDAILFAETFTGNFPDVEIARGECRGVLSEGGTSQVAIVRENLRIIGSLRRTDFSDPNDYTNESVGTATTILNAEGNGRVLLIDAGAIVTITQVALVNGDANAGSGNGNGGGLLVRNGGEILLEGALVCQSDATNGGGFYGDTNTVADITGVRIGFCAAGRITENSSGGIQSLQYVFFGGNNATNNGGGLYAVNRFDIRNVSFYSNDAGGNGGGLYNAGNNNRIINGTFLNNTAVSNGGGIYQAGDGLGIYHNTMLLNEALGGDGGAIWHNGNNVTLNSSIVYTNTASGTGGGLNSDAAAMSYNNFFDNDPNHTPGGIGTPVIVANPQLTGTLLTVDSPAIDAADPALLSSGAPGTDPFGLETIDYDRRLDERPDGEPDHTGIHGKGSDIGSDEYVKTFGCSVTPRTDEATVSPGQTVTYTFNVQNTGNYTDSLNISFTSSKGWGMLQNGSLHTVTLGQKDSVNRIITVTVPFTATAQTGLQDVSTIFCQSASLTSQTDSGKATTNAGIIDGVIVTPNYEDSALPGDVITFTHFVINQGSEATFNLTSSSGPRHATAVLVNPSGGVLTATTVTLQQNEVYTVLLRVNILSTAAANDDANPGVVAREVGNALNEGAAQNTIHIGFVSGTRYMAAFGAADSTNCTDPVNPCATIQYAHDQALDNDTILISAGTYTDTITRTVAGSAANQVAFLEKSVTIRGGYDVFDGFTSYEPITNAVTVSGEDVRRVFFITDGITVTLSSLFIENGTSALQGFAPEQGGAVYNSGANLTITGTWLTNNSAQVGGALYHQGDNLVMNSAVFAGNTKPAAVSGAGQGGAVYIDSGSSDLINNTFVDNSADNVSGAGATGNGGAVYVNGGSLDLYNNIFADNSGNAGARAAVVTPTVVFSRNNNLYWSGLGLFDQTNFITGTNSLTGNPQFADGLYHISAGSPAKDNGTDAGIVVGIDFELDSRPQGPFVDIGADERVQRPDFLFEPTSQTSTINSGERFTYTHWITNTGDADDSYTLTMENQSIPPGGSFTYALTPTVTPVLTRGESVTVTFVITGALPGYVDQTVITATSASLIAKSVVDTTAISQTARVDIEPSASGTGFPGQSISYTHTLTNTGNGIDSFTLRPLTATAVPTGWLVTVMPTQTGFITPGGTMPFTVTVDVPPGTVSGTVHTVNIEATATSPFASDMLTDTTTVGPAYGLTLTPDNSSNVLDNTQVVYTHTLQNSGNLTDTVQLSYRSVPSWTVDVSPMTVTLQPLVQETIFVTVTVPANTGGITHTAVISAASQGGLTVTAVNTTTVDTTYGVLLQPDSLIVSDAGTTVTHTHTMTNTGNVTDSYSVASDTTLGWLVSLTPGAIILGPGMTRTVTSTIDIPGGAAPGLADMTFITVTSQVSSTVFDRVVDTTRVRQVHGLIFAPDNVITTSAESTVTYTHVLTNTGNGTDSFNLTTTSSRGWPHGVVTSTPITIGNGLSQTVVVTLTVPLAGSGLTDTLHVTATSTISPAFTAAVTNTTIVTGTPVNFGVVIAPDNSGAGLPGETVTYTHVVTNTGDVQDSFTLGVMANNGWTTAVTPTALTLNQLQSAPVTVTVTISPTALNGEMNVVTVTAQSNTEPTAFDTAQDTTTVGQSYGVTLEPDNIAGVDAGTLVTYTHNVINTGNGTDTYTFAADSSQGWITAVPGNVTVGQGLSETIVVTLTVPSGAPGLQDTMTVTATSTIAGSVFDTAMNTTRVNGSVQTLGVAITPNNSSDAGAGTSATYNHTIQNTGTVTDDYTITAVSGQGWSFTLNTTQITLGPGQTANISVRVSVPGTAAVGTIDTTTVTITSNTDGAVNDSATDRTTVIPSDIFIYLPLIVKSSASTPSPTPTPTPTSPPPACTPTGVDLIVTEIRVEPAVPTAGQAATVYVTLRNQGSVDVTYGNNFYLDFYDNRIPATLVAGEIAWGVQGSDLTAGTSKTYSASYIFTGGTHQLYAQADTDNTVDECPNENNNILGPVSINVSGTFNQVEPTSRPGNLIVPRSTPTPALSGALTPVPLPSAAPPVEEE